MKLIEIITEKSIVPELKAETKSDAIKELAEAMCAVHKGIDAGELVRVLLDRERLGSTGLEDGVAIPHGKVKGFDKVAAVFGRSAAGVDFESIDGKPSNLFFLLVAPVNSAGSHLKALARIVRATKDPAFREALAGAPGAGEMYRAIVDVDEKIGEAR